MTPAPGPLDVAALVAATLTTLGVPYTIGGSIASSIAGEPRSTIDIDVVVALTADDILPLVSALSPAFYVDETAVRRAVALRSTVNLIHHDSGVKVDLFIAGGSPLDAEQLQRRQSVAITPSITLFVHPPEDILLQKLRWFRLGGETCDRQWRDVIGIVRVQGSRLDRHYLTRSAALIGVEDLLSRALGDRGVE